MNILVVAATPQEIQPCIPLLIQNNIDYLLTGVGMVATAFSLGQHLKEKSYDLILNVGIAGTFCKAHSLGNIYRIQNDSIYHLGAQDDQEFLSIEQLGFGKSTFSEVLPKQTLGIAFQQLPTINAITVNMVHGNRQSILEIIQERGENLLESMEGASFFYVTNHLGIPSIQIRAVSNLVETRNTTNWNIPKALGELNNWLESFILSQRQ